MNVEELFENYAEAIFKYIFLIVRDYALAEDLTQETFIKAQRKLAQFRGEATIKTWLYRVAHTTTLNHLRKKRLLLIDTEAKLTDKSAEERFFESEAVQQLYEKLASLKPNYRHVIVLRKIHQLSVKETGEVLGWGESKVKMTLARALKKLEQELRNDGGEGK